MKVEVSAKDMRSAMGPKVSAAINGIGFETHAIESDRPISTFVESALSAELARPRVSSGTRRGADRDPRRAFLQQLPTRR